MGIVKIENVSCKSFQNFSSSDNLSDVNIFFGTNGSGKTALSQWLKTTYNSIIKVFDTEYVLDNILAKDEIAGVKLTVGQEAINLEEMINVIADANCNLEVLISNFYEKIDLKKEKLFEILDVTLKQSKKQFLLNTNINQKANARSNPIEAYERWLNDIEENTKSDTVSSKELEQRKAIVSEEISKLVSVPNYDIDLVKQIFESLSESLIAPNEQISKNLRDWLLEGYEYHNMGSEHDNCQFCGNEFNPLLVQETIEKKIKSEHTKYVNQLEIFLDSLKNTEKYIKKISNIDIQHYLSLSEKIISLIEEKVDNTALKIDISISEYEQLISINNIIEEKRNDLSSELSEIENKLQKIELVAKSWIGKQLKSNNNIDRISKEIKELEKSASEYSIILNKNRQWILEKQKSNSDLKPFRDLVNRQFNVLGVDFELEIMDSGTHYLINHKKTNQPIMTKDLSEGERRLLGFLHFYFDLFDKPEESFMEDIEMIIIDDPITSLDSDNRYYLTELINKFIKKGISLGKQLFIFTHSSLDFHNFGYAVGSGVSFWKISKSLIGNSEIKIVSGEERKNYSNYYQTNFRSIFEYAILGKAKLSQNNFIHYGNKARLVLESHARAHYQIEYATNQSFNNLVEVYEIVEESQDEFKRMLDVINSLSHGMTFIDENEISSIEVQTNIRFLIKILYKKDKFHIEKMAGTLINKGNEKSIKSWLDTH